MALTRAIEQRLAQIQKDVNQGMMPEQGQVLISSADVNWLLIIARNAVQKEPAITKKHQKITRLVLYIFLSSLSVLSIAGILLAIKLVLKLF